MVNGLDIFAEYFKDYSKNYIIVGGTACSLAMSNEYHSFRQTHDIDMIVIVEELSSTFGMAFWNFIKEGEYEFWKSDDKIHFFRFLKPKNPNFPSMIELFSKKQDWLPDEMAGTYTKIIIDDEVSSLSAILLDDAYYQFLKSGVEIINGLPILKPLYLIAFKSKAHVDLNQKFLEGKHIDSRDLKKHKNDILCLRQLLKPEDTIDVSENIKQDLQSFIDMISKDNINMKQLGLRYSKEEVIATLKHAFKIN